MREKTVSRWSKLMLMNGVTSALLICELAGATESPSQALAILQYAMLACALIGLVGSVVMYVGGH
jgi:hypothetical protein